MNIGILAESNGLCPVVIGFHGPRVVFCVNCSFNHGKIFMFAAGERYYTGPAAKFTAYLMEHSFCSFIYVGKLLNCNLKKAQKCIKLKFSFVRKLAIYSSP